MSKAYNTAYIESHDIDWFCQIGDYVIHCASNCGLIPVKVNNRNQNRKIQEIVANRKCIIESSEDIIINKDYVFSRLRGNDSLRAYENYIASFVEMAKKGFISFDRMIDDNHESGVYVWIAKPKKNVEVRIENLPKYDEKACPTFRRGGKYLHVRCLDRCEE